MKNKRQQRTKRQHYVPRCYLSRFSRDGRSIWAFDKFTRRRFPGPFMGVAQENGFYDLPAKVLQRFGPGEDIDSQAVEKSLAVFDANMNLTIQQLLEDVEREGIRQELQQQLAIHTVMQLLRTREYRETIFEGYQKVSQTLANDSCQMNFPDLPPDQYPEVILGRENLPALHAGFLFHEGFVGTLAGCLLKHVWVVWANRTMQPFYTSDNPVIRNAHGQYSGVRSPGIEIAFPLSSQFLLVLYERSRFPQMLPFHRRAVQIDGIGVEYYNALQTLGSRRQVYCEADEFEQAEGVCRRHPEVCNETREKFDVASSGNTIVSQMRNLTETP